MRWTAPAGSQNHEPHLTDHDQRTGQLAAAPKWEAGDLLCGTCLKRACRTKGSGALCRLWPYAFHEIIPLDAYGYLSDPKAKLQSIFRHMHSTPSRPKTILRILQPDEFVPYQSMTYLVFYKDGERGGKKFRSLVRTFAMKVK